MRVGHKGLQFFQKLHSAIVSFRRGSTAFITTLLDTFCFGFMPLQELIVKFDPLVPVHVAESHSYVIRSIFEWAIGDGLGFVHIPVWIWGCYRALEVHRCPYSWGSHRGFERGPAFGTWFLKVG